MLHNLGKSLSSLIRKIITRTTVDKEAVESFIKELQKILLQADVSVELVHKLSSNIRKKCFEEKIPAGLTLREHVVKVVYDELVNLLGKEPSTLVGKKRIMLVGLFGSGKTTVAAKIARYLQKLGLKSAMVCCDYHRPAAPEQLKQLGEQIHVPVYINKSHDPYEAAKQALKELEKYDSIVVDTAGRDALDKKLAEELKKLGSIIKPDEVLLVIPADIGKVGGRQALEFNKLVGITGIVVTKLDATAKGGGALAACSATGAKIKLIGVGEKIEDLEVYDPTRFVSRLLGMGDLETLLEKAREAEIKEEDVEKIITGKFTLEDFYNQIEAMQKMGSLDKLMESIPGMAHQLPEDLLQTQEEKLKIFKVIIQSMTKEERKNPEVINASRVARIARGSGRKESEVRELLKQYAQAKKMMKKLGGMKGIKRGKINQLLRKFGIK